MGSGVGGATLRGHGFPKIFSVPTGEIVYTSDHKTFLQVHENPKTLYMYVCSLCVHVCVSVTLLNGTDRERDLVYKALEVGNDFDVV